MRYFGRFYLDKEKDMIVDLYLDETDSEAPLSYVLSTPNHNTGNLITNLAKLCGLPLSEDKRGWKIIRGEVPCYYDAYNNKVYIFRLGGTKTANIYPDGRIEMKASIPAISKTLMSQTKEYKLDIERTLIKTYIRSDTKFRTDLHTHMNANLPPDILIALGIAHQIRYPLYYIKKLDLKCTERQWEQLALQRAVVEESFKDSTLTGKYRTRRIDDNTFINFADLILCAPEYAAYNIARIRTSLAVMKDGQAVFTNLEKVYLYRYVFTKGTRADEQIELTDLDQIPDLDVRATLVQILKDRKTPEYQNNTLFQDKLLWIARNYKRRGIRYAEISDTTLVKKQEAWRMLEQVHGVMPAIYRETGVRIRFLAAIRRIPLTIIKDRITPNDYLLENLHVLEAVAPDPYVAGSDIVGEEINDIRELSSLIQEIVRIAGKNPGFVIRIHAGENDSLRGNVAHSIQCVKEALAPGQPMPPVRIGHGLYTTNLHSEKGRALMEEIRKNHVLLEFQITSNVRLNNLSDMEGHPLKTYLKAGIGCVQGTDGGALYGTDSIDEELALEKLLRLDAEDLHSMVATEQEVLKESERVFAQKEESFAAMIGPQTPGQWLRGRIRQEAADSPIVWKDMRKPEAVLSLSSSIEELPSTGTPIVIAGGSFNNDQRSTKIRESDKKLIDRLLDMLDPAQYFFVIGHRVTGQERYLVERNQGRFLIYAFVPNRIGQPEKVRILKAGLKVRVAIESSSMGLYKSISYEVFKHRPSVLIAFDGNSAGANLIQEAKNSKYKALILISRQSRVLKAKAGALQGYVTIFGPEDDILTQIQRWEGN